MDYFASGKLLLFGEYLVLKGSKSLSIPLRYGQKMTIQNSANENLNWISRVNEKTWFSAVFSKNLEVLHSSNVENAEIIKKLLRIIKRERPALFSTGLHIEINGDFPLNWGFGSSSTLISLVAQWSEIDPYFLLKKSFGGSGYDVACATAKSPIIFQKKENEITPVILSSEITSQLLFIYSGEKQNTRNEINRFKRLNVRIEDACLMDEIILSVVNANQIDEFEKCIVESETLLSGILNLPTIKNDKFKDYPYTMKSLGAWGGDFFMATFRHKEAAGNYFSNLGFPIQFTYSQLIRK